MKESNKAITLIALIITIIVLLILAGLTINMVLGDNGLFNKAKTSVAKYENAQEKENSILAGYEAEIDNASRETVTISKDEYDNLIARITALENANNQEILWTNPNPSADFEAQTVNWTSTEYDQFYVVFKNYKGDNTSIKKIPINRIRRCTRSNWVSFFFN